MQPKDLRNLIESYQSIYSDEVVSEDLQKTVEKGLDAAAKNPVIKAIGKVIAPVGKGRGTVTKAEQEAKIKKESAEPYDVILGHLLDEGYTDSVENAERIMSVMSDEWMQSILEAKKEKEEEEEEEEEEGEEEEDEEEEDKKKSKKGMKKRMKK